MKISFIVPAYNAQDYITKCIQSVILQTKSDWELIIIDDGSTDNTFTIVKDFICQYPQIRLFHQDNQGVSAARNRGIMLAKGEWVGFIDADDSIHPRLLEAFWDCLNDENDVGFFQHKEVPNKFYNSLKYDRISQEPQFLSGQDLKEIQYAVFNRDKSGRYDYHKLKPSTPVKLYRKKILTDNNIFFHQGLKTGEDALFNLYVYRYARKAIYVEEPLYYHRIWNGSVSHKYNDRCEEDFLFLHKLMKEFIETAEDPSSFQSSYRERVAWSFGFCCLLDYCHRNNPKCYAERKNDFLNAYIQRYQNQFKALDLSQFRLSKRMFFLAIRYKLFFLLCVFCRLGT